MDLSRANYIVDTLHNAANDLHNLAHEERDQVARDWLERLSVSLQLKALEVVGLPMDGFQEAFPLVRGEAPPLEPVPAGMSVSGNADGFVGA